MRKKDYKVKQANILKLKAFKNRIKKDNNNGKRNIQ
jgi:hypothetical protein